MQLSEERLGDACLLKASGRIDRAAVESFRTALQPYLEQCKPGGHVIVLDLSAIDYISSLGFQVLLVAQRRAKAQYGSIAIAALQPGVKAIFEVANFGNVIRCFESVRDALAVLSHSALASYTPRA
ncbi:MAG: STAS domain-containing protein [Sulfuricaulis sp.]|nr:STAS domain-containing protein [Sulfuricaulis sp.]